MRDELHWGGINLKSLCKALVFNIWMVFAVMIITYIGLGIVGNMKYTPSYTSNTVVAVYPFNKMYTLEDTSGALQTVTAVNEVLNSDMFKEGLGERLEEPVDFSLYSHQIDSTYLLMLSASSSSPDNAYKILRTALDYYGEISSHIVGDSHLSVVTEPNFPTSVSNESGILRRRPLLTLLMGFAMAGFLVLMYVMRRTYKTSSAIRHYYKDVRFFKVKASVDKLNRRNKKRSGLVPDQEAMRRTALELWQMLRAKNGNSVFLTSAARDEGKTDITVSLAREMARAGKTVAILETDPENTDIQERVGKESSADIPDQSIRVVFADKTNMPDDLHSMAESVEKILEQARENADIILIDGCIWAGSGDERIWKDAADISLAICRQDKANFYAIDRMMTDLQDNDPGVPGCVLYGF